MNEVHAMSNNVLDAKAPRWLLDKLGITQRQWKSKKRKELKQLIKLFENYRLGCFYCPNYDTEIQDLERVLEQMKESHSVKNWGR